jgi:hypothetical protein
MPSPLLEGPAPQRGGAPGPGPLSRSLFSRLVVKCVNRPFRTLLLSTAGQPPRQVARRSSGWSRPEMVV